MGRAFFLDHPDDGSQRLCIHHAAQGARRGRVVYVHPFVEEMNKSRRMAALQARALAAAGFAVLQIDLLGCGDSSGDFGDASWEAWIDDVVRAAGWLTAHEGSDAPLWLWGLRAGALLASAAAARLDEPAHLLLWQPATQGKLQLQQFLRLKAAAELAAGAKGVTEQLRAQLEAGQPVEIAGYLLAPALANGLANATLAAPPTDGVTRNVVWLELSTQENAELLPASQAPLKRLRDAGCEVVAEVVNGPAFWQTTEIETAPTLIERTLGLIGGAP